MTATHRQARQTLEEFAAKLAAEKLSPERYAAASRLPKR